ncbi:unnamed protein product [Rotaria sp. Silwood2]|nr:unnamed protein product [Rotaria sp. Silwood2]CAF2577793.1 unnamed protein product [Rotaria sp. Silwood2]CAF2824932.1 unnamed protein product [Rotaria sp. Silwood2]CAF2985924.1 unnamed protein product [Rotaria sp. Silwood2]CAF4073259.1 unnamed protein product [Rotaria sp. Silwood2]
MSYHHYLKRLLRITPKYDQSLIIRNVAYFSGSNAHVNNKMDIFLPFPNSNLSVLISAEQQETNNKQIPVIVHIHGGGWVRGSRTNEWRGGPTVGRTCAREGFVGIVVSYRLARISLISFIAWSFVFGLIIIIIGLSLLSWQLITGYVAFMTFAYAYNFLYKVRVPVNVEDMMDDLCRALVYIRDHINEHCSDADPNQIFLSGHSSGAHLVSLLVLDKSHLHRHEFSLSIIRGVVSMSGIYNLANPTHDSKNNIRNIMFRIFYSSNLLYPEGKQMNEYSPIEYVKQDEEIPPFLVMSARFDLGLEFDAKRFVEKLKNYQHSVDYVTVNGTHGTIATKFAKNDAHKHFFKFILQHMNY